MARMGYESEANNIQSFPVRERDEAIRAVPDAFADEISLVGPLERIKNVWSYGKISSNNSYHWRNDLETMRLMAELFCRKQHTNLQSPRKVVIDLIRASPYG